MTTSVRIAILIAFLALTADEVHALVYADEVKLDKSLNGRVVNLGDSAKGVSETDDKRAFYINSRGILSSFEVTYGFPDFSVNAGDHTAYLIVDKDVRGTVSARVTSVNGDTTYGGSAVSISGTKLNDKLFGLSFSVDKALDVTTVSFLILVSDAAKKGAIQIDAVALPETGTWLLFSIGAAGLAAWRFRRRRRG